MSITRLNTAQADTRQVLFHPISATEYRVVHLLPGIFLDEIQCVLETRSTRVQTHYEALSYQWGDKSSTKPVRIAPFDPSSHPTSGILAGPLPKGVAEPVLQKSGVIYTATKPYVTLLWTLAWSVQAVLIWRLLLSLPAEPPNWVPVTISRHVWVALLSMLSGMGVLNLLTKGWRLSVEVIETKPRVLVSRFMTSHFEHQTRKDIFNFETLQVTTNLELALRYLRQEKCVRTLWVDALCINQDNEEEKTAQIQHMDWLYANSSPVVVWLGGHHDPEKEYICAKSSLQDNFDCEHRRQIQAAFNYIQALGGWRLLFGWCLRREDDERFPEWLSGLCEVVRRRCCNGREDDERSPEWLSGLREVARRGWWERLWVIQEVALATGRVQLQCGRSTCDIEDFEVVHHLIREECSEDKALQEDFRLSQRILATIKDFRYSSFQDRGTFLAGALGTIRRKSTDVPQFHEQPFPQRLHRILLRTSGHFKSGDDRDRLFAVLGIAGGATTVSASRMAKLVETISNPATYLAILAQKNSLSTSTISAKINHIRLSCLCSSWGRDYDVWARHWAIPRPIYHVAGYGKVIDAVAGNAGKQLSRADFFTAIAGYLAKETGSLSFLDVANCGDDKDATMPSWVPNWSRKVNERAYDFASRVKNEPATTNFEFTEGGKTLHLTGKSIGRVNTISSTDLDMLESSPWQGNFVKRLVLPDHTKRDVAQYLETISTMLSEISFSMLNDTENELISATSGLIKIRFDIGFHLVRKSNKTMVYSDDGSFRKVGFLRVGDAAKGDRLVFVPGCFHHLLLRRSGRTAENSIRWKLVGLVEMGAMPLRAGRPYATHLTQWAREMALENYAIE
ncbi:heterokaryon incompatibility protein-domain-containing protein [Ilyonectria robusta]|uniref:heterokaryon incompatibility protein-domain-containing protein n=1 Tax=Ilyonectria robusta TaxID=1079257 RepID=UPI001E8D91E3|nr:heterokaryon incompatibility protein-domain-containing protein [Ilyonectria robusta]KAH8694427.1 heterokaryon incompatibility protein-domain-containing protein [Ilyonectria robusta]